MKLLIVLPEIILPYAKACRPISAAVIASMVLLTGCGEKSKSAHTTADTTITFFKLAVLPTDAAPYRGKPIYDTYCAICHGETGDGNGFNAYNLKSSFDVMPFNFTDSIAMAKLSEEEMKLAISKGGPAVKKTPYMPPWGGVLTEEDIEPLCAYVRTFAKAGKSD